MGEIIDIIIEPVAAQNAQIGTLVVLVLTTLDVVSGCLSAHLHDEFSSHKLRAGLICKVQNFLLLVACAFIDVALLGGLNLPFSPVYLAFCTALIVMEVKSLVEIWKRDHPDMTDAIGNVFGGIENDD